MKETILLFNITDRNTKLKLERILLPLKLRIRRIPVSQYEQLHCVAWKNLLICPPRALLPRLFPIL